MSIFFKSKKKQIFFRREGVLRFEPHHNKRYKKLPLVSMSEVGHGKQE